MDDAELRDSVRVIGTLLPILTCSGTVLDGRRRQEAAQQVGRTPLRLELDRSNALRALWLLEPARAIELAGPLRLDEYAHTFGVRPLAVAQVLRAQRVQVVVPETLAPEPAKAILLQAWIPPSLKTTVQNVARERGQNLSAFVREALVTHLARVSPATLSAPVAVGREHLGQVDGRTGPRKPRACAGSPRRARAG